MEKIHKAARAHYDAGPEAFKKEARNLFSNMDRNGDGKVSRFEFIKCLKGCDENTLMAFFDAVDVDGSGALDFWESVTFYYLITVGFPPSCDNCGADLLDMYYTCDTCLCGVVCEANDSFDLCTNCYNKTDVRNHLHKEFTYLNGLTRKRLESALQDLLSGKTSSSSSRSLSSLSSKGTKSDKLLKGLEVVKNVMEAVSSVEADTWTDLADFGVNAAAACSLM